MRETQLFDVTASAGSLVITPKGSPHVISWAPVNGGMRTHAQHILIHRVESSISEEQLPAAIRRGASQARLSGTIVGMATSGRISDYGIAEAKHEELVAAALCSASLLGLRAVGETEKSAMPNLLESSRGGIHLVVAVNYSLTHEAMLEAIGIVTEAKVCILHELLLRDRETGKLATGGPMDCVAITAGHDRRYTSAGKASRWGQLIGQAAMKSLRIAIQKSIASAADNPLNGSPPPMRESSGG